jgi:hypothetical protein
MARLIPEFVPPAQLSEDDIARIVALGKAQAELMDQLQAALAAADDLQALNVAHKLVALEREVRETQ